jgi:hypothetical protein
MRNAYLPSAELSRAILDLYNSADSAARNDGMEWYTIARNDCAEFAREFNLDIVTAVGIVAALSPNMRWDRNIKAARALIQGETCAAYPANRDKANRILAGELPLDVLGGLKVRAFYGNILSAGSDVNVTIDGHAFNAAHGIAQPVKNANVTPREFARLTRAYRVAARIVGIPAPAMQAIVWVVWTRAQLDGTRYRHVPIQGRA